MALLIFSGKVFRLFSGKPEKKGLMGDLCTRFTIVCKNKIVLPSRASLVCQRETFLDLSQKNREHRSTEDVYIRLYNSL